MYINLKEVKRVYLAVFVNDGQVAATHEGLVAKLLENLSCNLEIMSTITVQNYLGLEMMRVADESVFLNQSTHM